MCKSFCYGGPIFEAVRDHQANEKPNALKETIISTKVDISKRMGFFDLKNVFVQDDIKMNILILITKPVTDEALWQKLLKNHKQTHSK